MLWFKLKPWFEQNQCHVFPPKPSFTQRAALHKELFYAKSCFTQRAVLHQTVFSTNNTMFYTQTIFLLGLRKGCLQLTGIIPFLWQFLFFETTNKTKHHWLYGGLLKCGYPKIIQN